ncbi:unnamed protein product, partial [Schistosoma curassoni]|uniref:Uncharacterized protein n=1 Tax=Schistosoma curassoni TaxID=6186 RepID=A0A183L745_9TREM
TTVVTTTNTTNVYTLNKDIINTVTNKSKQAVQIFFSETSPSLCKRNSPRKYSSHDTYSNDSSPELTYNSREPLTHSVIVSTSRELYKEFNDFTSLSKNCSTYEHSNDQDDIKRNKFNMDEKIKLKQLNNKLKHKNSFNSSIKLLSHTGVSY